jgi:hypothetical protein
MFSQPVRSKAKTPQTSLTFYLLSLEENEAQWQQFVCPMDFPQCHYNWCASGENRDVNIYFSYNYFFFSFLLMLIVLE